MNPPKEYKAWWAMNNRCTNPKNARYKNYGNRGISVCSRWHDFNKFYADMGPATPGFSIERINNDGNYEPSNCRWATPREQANNRTKNRIFSLNGEAKTMTQWARDRNIKWQSLASRLYRGMNIEKALSIPIRKYG